MVLPLVRVISIRIRTVLLPLLIALPTFTLAAAQGEEGPAIQIIDAVTGFAVPGVRLSINRLSPGEQEVRLTAEGYRPTVARVATGGERRQIRLLVEPVKEPEHLRPAAIRERQRADSTLFLGFIGDAQTGRPLAGARVESSPSGVTTEADADGFFELAVPLSRDGEMVSLHVLAEGFEAQEFLNIELWPFGDWTYRISLRRGDGVRLIDEAEKRRAGRGVAPSADDASAFEPTAAEEAAMAFDQAEAMTAAASPLTVRTPRHIRVLLEDNVTIEYVPMELYVRRSLPREWIASWGNIAGGANSLRAGAVAIRTYAIGFVNNPRASDHDICATTSCQVYGSTTNANTDAAVAATTHYVMVNTNGAITLRMTEYSAENNSLGFPCGDGYTSPTGGCIFDPVCTGEIRFGHGRGLCQWGSARWATGRKMAGRVTGDATPNGFPTKDWVGILEHYYPNFTLIEGAPLVVGDGVRVSGNTSRPVRLCPGGGIELGTGCAQIATMAPGSTGLIIDGPVLVTSDGVGHTWWKVVWNNANQTTGWSAENWLERDLSPPPPPQNLTAAAVSTSRIDLSWTMSGTRHDGFLIERAFSSAGPWQEIATANASARAYADLDLQPSTTYFYRLRATNITGASSPSNIASATTADVPPALDPIPDQTINENVLLTFTAVGTAPDRIIPLADFEGFNAPTANGTVLFREPRFSGTTNSLLDASPNLSRVLSTLPVGNESSRALQAQWSWNTGANPWLRLTTFDPTNLRNPVIDLNQKLRFRLHTDRAIRVALGVRQTNNPPGTPIGSNGGTSGDIKFVGASSRTGGAPNATRTFPAGTWHTVEFNFATEPSTPFTGTGPLVSTTGLGVLENLALVPADGVGTYTLHLDDFAVVERRTLTYSLDSGAPAGALIDPATGVFTWTPSEAQGPGIYPITIRVTDDRSPPQSASRTVTVTVNEVNQAPALAPIADRAIHAGAKVVVQASATDPDLPPNTLTFSLDAPVPPGATVHPSTGVFNWTSDISDAAKTYPVTIRVTDNGAPPMSASRTFQIQIVAPLRVREISRTATHLVLSWPAVAGQRYQVQSKLEVTDPEWTALDLEVVAQSGEVQLEIPIDPALPRQFFRVMSAPH